MVWIGGSTSPRRFAAPLPIITPGPPGCCPKLNDDVDCPAKMAGVVNGLRSAAFAENVREPFGAPEGLARRAVRGAVVRPQVTIAACETLGQWTGRHDPTISRRSEVGDYRT